MNRANRKPRTPSDLSESTHQRLNSYALAASAAGVGLLALSPPAEAKIVYTPTHHVIMKGVSYKLDLNHDGRTDFTLQAKASSNTSTYFLNLSAIPAAGNGVRGFGGNPGWASALKPDSAVGRYQYFNGQAMANVALTGGGGTYFAGSWVNVKNRYLGLQFKIAGKTHYGWARLNVQVSRTSIVATLTGYAYETVPNKSIHTGQTKGGEAATGGEGVIVRRAPESRTLGSLALGSRGPA
jgi:hypothetical protein